ncbi:uncharacterized protein EV420DRAFT_1640966 [Desarmillaria tabescens]|uniref:Uncharacterized protein n=1 Tax=Armillaria tabescens TaxID=1929756 RepID=A0AA39KI28_ARMTA|nr:uncharacterized protein EV420DRAFT_1640966 [Desarmillaria tabescens]KAK0460421.1 hypothetical protein EV420DRAFT_1640966 [Desarmillaria tabescens]
MKVDIEDNLLLDGGDASHNRTESHYTGVFICGPLLVATLRDWGYCLFRWKAYQINHFISVLRDSGMFAVIVFVIVAHVLLSGLYTDRHGDVRGWNSLHPSMSFGGGNPDDVQLLRLSRSGGTKELIHLTSLFQGAYAVHQDLHHLSEGVKSPFQSVHLMSNTMVSLTPKTRAEMRPQFQAFCRAMHLEPTSSTILDGPAGPVEMRPAVLSKAKPSVQATASSADARPQ